MSNNNLRTLQVYQEDKNQSPPVGGGDYKKGKNNDSPTPRPEEGQIHSDDGNTGF